MPSQKKPRALPATLDQEQKKLLLKLQPNQEYRAGDLLAFLPPANVPASRELARRQLGRLIARLNEVLGVHRAGKVEVVKRGPHSHWIWKVDARGQIKADLLLGVPTDHEALEGLLLLEQTCHFLEGLPGAEQLQHTLRRLRRNLGGVDGGPGIHFTDHRPTPILPAVWMSTQQAIHKRQCLRITGCRNDGKAYDQVVSPLGILHHEFYYLAYTHADGRQLRTVRMDRLTGAALDDRAPWREPADWEGLPKALEDGYGLPSHGEPIYDILLRVSKEDKHKVKDHLFHPKQEVRDDPEGPLWIRIRTAGLTLLLRDIAKWEGQVEWMEARGLDAESAAPKIKEELANCQELSAREAIVLRAHRLAKRHADRATLALECQAGWDRFTPPPTATKPAQSAAQTGKAKARKRITGQI